ncbi:MAG: hypothetical protein ABI983_00760 [Acidobacteriota bacterium]
MLAIVLAAQPELIERTLALVGGQPITLGDTRAATALGLLDANLSPASDVLSRLVDRELILREVQRYGPAAPAESAVDARLDEIRKRFPDAAALSRVLDGTGFSEVRLRSWVRDDLRGQAYLAQRFASASTPADAEVMRVYTEQRAQFDQQRLTFEQAAPGIRDRLLGARRIELINDWLSDLRRRTDVVLLPQ